VFTVYVAVTVVTMLANVCMAAAALAPARFVLANMDEVGVPRPWRSRSADVTACHRGAVRYDG